MGRRQSDGNIVTVRGKGADPRQKKVRVRGGKGRTASSRQWLERQLNDPYVARAKREGARSRAAYKLIEIDDKARFLRKGMRVVDLGAAPGGWSQVAAERVGAPQHGKVIAIDILSMEPVPGVDFIRLAFLDPAAAGGRRKCWADPLMRIPPTWRPTRPDTRAPTTLKSCVGGGGADFLLATCLRPTAPLAPGFWGRVAPRLRYWRKAPTCKSVKHVSRRQIAGMDPNYIFWPRDFAWRPDIAN
jgi:hypothetical protein